MYSDHLSFVAAFLIIVQAVEVANDTLQMKFRTDKTKTSTAQPLLSLKSLNSSSSIITDENKARSDDTERIRASKGTDVKPGEFPFMVAIQKATDWAETICGGSLVTSRHILTACTCMAIPSVFEPPKMISAKDISVMAGALNTTEGGWKTGSRRDALILRRHPMCLNLYTGFMWDFGIITVTRRFRLNPGHIGVIPLPSYTNETVRTMVSKGTTCISMGWGQNPTGQTSSEMLKKVRLALMPFDECYRTLLMEAKATSKNMRFNREFQVCAVGPDGEDTCDGDTGGPLICFPKKGETLLTGIVTWDLSCGKDNVPGIYARMDVAESWVREVISIAMSNSPCFLANFGVVLIIIKTIHSSFLSCCFLR